MTYTGARYCPCSSQCGCCFIVAGQREREHQEPLMSPQKHATAPTRKSVVPERTAPLHPNSIKNNRLQVTHTHTQYAV